MSLAGTASRFRCRASPGKHHRPLSLEPRMGTCMSLIRRLAFSAEAVERQVNYGSRVDSEELRDREASKHGVAEWHAQFGARSRREHEGQRAEHRRKRRHQDWPEALKTGLPNGVLTAEPLAAFRIERKIDEHDPVLLHDADQQDNADQRNDGQPLAGRVQSEERAKDGCRQRGKDSERVNEVLIQNAQHEINSNKRGYNQK